jgi:formamidopyrimidine-DNA glycosylase
VVVRNRALRWPVPTNLSRSITGRRIRSIERRSKYLLFHCETGWLLLHLGMSGSLQVVESDTPAQKHDHFDLVLESGKSIRLNDPRRFGAVLWLTGAPEQHPLLSHLAPEPLGNEFDAEWLFRHTRGRRAAIKTVIMDSHIVVGVGNIYAAEALFSAQINPKTPAGRLSRARCEALVGAIRGTLAEAIRAGGSSLRDYVGADGAPGTYQEGHQVYGRAGESCRVCGSKIRGIRQGQRASYYCPKCQR